jgi:AcrR family transcriptional regulator
VLVGYEGEHFAAAATGGTLRHCKSIAYCCSRETLARLITATLATLEEHGLEGAPVSRIAGVAGIAPASVYRRFRDRNALYRVALLEMLEGSADQDFVSEQFTVNSIRVE